MHVRPPPPRTFRAAATIISAAFEADELWKFLMTDRAKHPLSWRQHVLKTQRNKYYRLNAWAFVCVADTNDDFAAADPWTPHMSVLERFEGWLRWAEIKWEETLCNNLAMPWARQDTFNENRRYADGVRTFACCDVLVPG
jgi:hypothetical protein